MLRKGHGGLYKAPTKEERRKQEAKSCERSDQKKFSLVLLQTSNQREVRLLLRKKFFQVKPTVLPINHLFSLEFSLLT